MTKLVASDEDLRSISNVYALLGRFWLQELDQASFDALLAEPLRTAFQVEAVGPALSESDSLDDLAIEYCGLFVGPRDHLPPMQSVWQEGQLASDVSASMRTFADAIHYEPSDAYPNTLDDHLGIQLEVMSSAVRALAAASLEVDDDEGQDRYDATVEFIRTFFRRHLTWTGPLLTAARERATSNFYRTLAVHTEGFLSAEQAIWLGADS